MNAHQEHDACSLALHRLTAGKTRRDPMLLLQDGITACLAVADVSREVLNHLNRSATASTAPSDV
jgi:hypothetical protein